VGHHLATRIVAPLVEGCKLWREEGGGSHQGRITALAVGDQGRLVISGGEDKRVIIWRPE
jgi:hypothetical protein